MRAPIAVQEIKSPIYCGVNVSRISVAAGKPNSASSKRNLLLSYSPYDESKGSHPRVVTMQQLIEIAQRYFNNVEVVSAGYFTHNKLNSTEHFLAASNEAEVLIVCTN